MCLVSIVSSSLISSFGHLAFGSSPAQLCVMIAFDVRTPSQVHLVKRSKCQARYSSYNNDSRSSTRILGVCACTRVYAASMSCRSIDYTGYK